MAKRSSLRASDADRDRVVERLRQAAMEGRLLAHELDERLATALRARTYGELDEVVFDLPGVARPRPRSSRLTFSHPATAVAVLVIGTMIAFVLAAVVVATFIAFSGVWVVLALVFLMSRGGWYGPRRRRRGPPLGGPGSRASRSARWVP